MMIRGARARAASQSQSPELTNLDNRTVHVLPFFKLSHIPCITSLKIMTGKSGGSDRLSHAGGGQHTRAHTRTHATCSDNNRHAERDTCIIIKIIILLLLGVHVCERAICHYYDNAKTSLTLSPSVSRSLSLYPVSLFRQTS